MAKTKGLDRITALYERLSRDDEQQSLEKKIAELSEVSSSYQVPKINPDKFVALIKKYKYPKELTREMVREIIDKIVVHQAEGENSDRTQQIDIYFNFIGEYRLELTKKELAERQTAAEVIAELLMKFTG